ARLGSTEGTSTAAVQARVLQTMGTAVPPGKVVMYVKDASVFDTGAPAPTTDAQLEALPSIELLDAAPRSMFMVRAKVAYNDICLVPMPFLRDLTLDAQAFMRRE
ncbi:MAG TPA: hypothetical protein PKC18_13310, partial [Lacipirellulaceae bacterium]|nr:hypothetical protein [Lacipirellulaceae bacterium]